MAYDPLFKMSIQDASGSYYYATLLNDGSYSINTSTEIKYLQSLPEGWENTSVTWSRDTYYMGIFRSMSSNGSYSFGLDGRAIINYIRNIGGIQGFGTLTIWMFNAGATTWEYQIFYQSQLDYKTYKDNIQTLLVDIATLDSKILRDLHAKGDTKFNVPVWKNTSTTPTPTWELNDSFPIWHQGIKLLYSANWTSAAHVNTDGFGTDDPVKYYVTDGNQLGGFNHGAVGDGYHIIPCMNQYNIVQNNGTTTFIGNDILQPFLIQGNQIPGAANIGSESNFNDVNHSQPYTRNNFVIKHLLPIGNGEFQMNASVKGTFKTHFGLPLDEGYLYASNIYPDNVTFISFVLFEIDQFNMPVTDPASGRYLYQEILKIPLVHSLGAPTANEMSPTGLSDGYFDNTNTPSAITLRYGKVYIMGIIYDIEGTYTDPGIPGSNYLSFALGSLTLNMASLYDMGASGVPIPAPSFPPSITAAFRPATLLEKLVPYLATTQTDDYGFPISVPTDYAGVSTYLSDPFAEPIGDMIPYQIGFTSGYCIHNLEGQSFVTVSLNQLYNFFNKVGGCGAYILGSTFFIEKLSTIFDSSTMILDLGYDVAEFTIEQVVENMGANLKLGYVKADTNSDFGVDSFNTELYFNTPLTNLPNVMDYEEAEVVVDQYAIEKIRAQRVTQPIGQSYNPANPSGDNTLIALYCYSDPYGVKRMVDPSNREVALMSYTLDQYNGDPRLHGGITPQTTDPSASLAPYIQGLYYPETATNLQISPCRALNRDVGAMLHSVLDTMDAEYLTFRNTAVMQYNNVPIGLTGISSNLQIGMSLSPIKEFSDKPIGNLPPQLFKPILLKVKSKYPVNLYQILNTNPNGYVRFFWKDKNFNSKEYKFFITKAVQSAGTGMATDFTGWALPDTVL